MNDGFTHRLRAGEWVQVRSKGEILATLDANGRLDELPFMPEMLEYCGKILRVGKRAHKTCDPAVGIGGRKMSNTVHLENIRCNGAAHDGCEAGCLIFWKEAWLKRLDHDTSARDESISSACDRSRQAGCTEDVLRSGTKLASAPGEVEVTYVCQNTQIKFATQPLSWWDIRQYVDVRQCAHVAVGGRLLVLPVANVCRSRHRGRLGDALDL
jgi:hypothetical protein